MWGMTKKVFREEGGVRGLYRGLAATAFGVAPYVGINFAAYEALRGVLTPPGKSSVPRKLLCGALAGERFHFNLFGFVLTQYSGSISQTLTYPVDVIRRKMQVSGMASGSYGPRYTGGIDALRGVVRVDGFSGSTFCIGIVTWLNCGSFRRLVQRSLAQPTYVLFHASIH